MVLQPFQLCADACTAASAMSTRNTLLHVLGFQLLLDVCEEGKVCACCACTAAGSGMYHSSSILGIGYLQEIHVAVLPDYRIILTIAEAHDRSGAANRVTLWLTVRCVCPCIHMYNSCCPP